MRSREKLVYCACSRFRVTITLASCFISVQIVMEAHKNDNDVNAAVCFMKDKDVELTVEEAVQFFGMKNSENVACVPPALPNGGEIYLFVNDDPCKSGKLCRNRYYLNYNSIQSLMHACIIAASYIATIIAIWQHYNCCMLYFPYMTWCVRRYTGSYLWLIVSYIECWNHIALLTQLLSKKTVHLCSTFIKRPYIIKDLRYSHISRCKMH